MAAVYRVPRMGPRVMGGPGSPHLQVGNWPKSREGDKAHLETQEKGWNLKAEDPVKGRQSIW